MEGHWVAGDEATADKLNASLWQRGLAANRPAAGQKGRIYVSTDVGGEKVERDTGTGWESILTVDNAVDVPSLRTLGTGALQAAAGNHTHT